VASRKTSIGLLRAIGLRLLYGLVSLLFLSFATFAIDEIAPGDAALLVAGEKATPDRVEAVRHNMGLDRPWPIRYVEFVGKAARGDLGNTVTGNREPVNEIIGHALPMTLMIALPAIFLAAGLGIILGTLAAIKQTKATDQAILGFSTLGVTLPNFVLGPVLVLIFAVNLDLLPTTWESTLRAPLPVYLILPVLVLSLRPMASLTRLTRASMIETLSQEFIKLARAKGVPPWRLYVKHGLRNAILPVITAIGTSFGFLLTGSFIVETIFLMPGMGQTAIRAIIDNDSALVMGTVLVSGALFIVVNLIVDIIQPILDPRIRESQV
jgi:peptide/nickel transport system permease protein